MSEQIRVVFIGGLTNGYIVYDYLKKNKYVDIALAITYKDDFSGARFQRIPDSKEVLRSGSTKECIQVISDINPDLIIVAGWSELIPDTILNIAPMGCYGFHPAKLPMDRGRSVLAWQLEDGYTETALTMFKYTNYPDGGDIIAQELIKIDFEDYINDILDKIDIATLNIMRAYFPLLRQGLIEPRRQNLSEGNFRRLRGTADSIINWNQNSETIYNKVRAISHPYPGATAKIDNRDIIVWRSKICNDFPFGCEQPAGTMIAKLFDNSLVFRTRNGFLHITEYQFL